MDDLTLLKSAGFSTTGVLIALLVYRVLKTMNGKKFVSSCCGKKTEIGFQVAEMTPPATTQNPLVIVRP